MRRAALTLMIPLVCVSVSQAQLASPLELVRGLRAAGLQDLAIERLNELKAKPGSLTPDEVKLLALEIATTRLELAIAESEDGKRAALIAQAQGEFDAFIKANPTHPATSQANMEIARLIAVNAKGLLSKGRRLDNLEARAVEFSKVRPEFDKAISRYQGAITTLEARLKTLDPKDPLAVSLNRSMVQAMVDAAVLSYEKAKTFIGESERAKSSEEMNKALKAFAKITEKYGANRYGYLASVWQIQCEFEIVDPGKSTKAMEAFIQANRTNGEAYEAVRLAQYFLIEHLNGADTKDPIGLKLRVEAAANEWLRKYPDARNSREGLRARYLYLGLTKQDRARPGIKVDPKTGRVTSITPEARGLLEAANKIYADLIETDNEYSDRAANFRLRNMVDLLDAAGAGKDTPITAIRSLEQGYIAAQIQQARIRQLKDKPASAAPQSINLEVPKDPKTPPAKGKEPAKEAPKAKEPLKEEMAEEPKEGKKVVTEEDRRVNLAIAYLERGLSMVGPKDSPRDILNAQLLLALFLKEADRYVEAAVLCDGLARNNPKMSKGALAAQLGVDSYNTALGKLKESVNKTEDAIAADVARIKALAQFADQTWPNEPPTDGVRQSLAFYLNQEKDYEGAWSTLNRVTNAYPAIYQVRWAQAAAMFFMVNPTTRDPKQYREQLQKNITAKSAQWVQTISQLEALPEPPVAVDTAKATSYMNARTMLAQLYFMAADYAKCEATVKSTQAIAAKLTGLDATVKADLIADVRVQHFRSLSGRAAEFIKAKEFGKVMETLDAEITALATELKTPVANPTPASERLRGAQRNLIIAAMTACVQDKKVDKAGELLEVLQSGGGSIESNISVMQQLVQAIRGQIDGLKKENKLDEAKELTESFSAFLDKIGSDPAKLPNSIISFLGQGFSSVDQHLKAVNLYQQALAKEFVNPGKNQAEKDEAEKADTAFRRKLKFEQAHSLRLAGGDENFKKATALMREIVGDPIAAKAPPKGWGYSNIAMRKEYIYLLEDQKLFRPAIDNWLRLGKEFVPTIPPLPKEGDKDGAQKASKRQLFFDLAYETQRASAKAYASIDPAKFKGGKEAIDGKLSDIGQKLFDLMESNKDVSTELREKIVTLANEYPAIKKKFDELTAKAGKKE